MAQRKLKTATDLNNPKGISTSRFFILSSIVIIFITVFIYSKSLNSELTQWDDDIYITDFIADTYKERTAKKCGSKRKPKK